MQDLATFGNDEALPPLIQAAIAHAQWNRAWEAVGLLDLIEALEAGE